MMFQHPKPGDHFLYYRGDLFTVTLSFEQAVSGDAFFRTNLGQAGVIIEEIIRTTESGRAPQGCDWRDLPMKRVDDRTFTLTLALTEVGHFEGKCFFFPEGEEQPIWPHGPNLHLNVEPVSYVAGNSIYCAFVRQFGRNKLLAKGDENPELSVLEADGFATIPPSGTFRDLINELDFIFEELHCRILHLLPINPTPTTYGRMGRFGSPYAALDFTAVDPGLAEFDRSATPLEQFLELVDAVHQRRGKLIIDIAINHTGWAAKLHETNPEWLVRKADGEIVSPGAWGVVWGDLTELNFDHKELWQYLADVFLTWCERGVDGFRCDAGYMIPVPAWRYIIARVRKQYPSTIFLLEGLGGDPAITHDLLNAGNMNWAYSELFQNYSREQIENYLSSTLVTSNADGLMVHYAETHDNSRLAADSPVYAQMRTALAALLSVNGAFGFTNGVEWFATEKVDVHKDCGLNWGSKINQVEFIANLNRLLLNHKAFQNKAELQFLKSHHHEVIAARRSDSLDATEVLVLINLNVKEYITTKIHESAFGFNSPRFYDLVNHSERVINKADKDGLIHFELAPGETCCFSTQRADLEMLLNEPAVSPIEKQRAQAMAMDLFTWKKGSIEVDDTFCPVEAASSLMANPVAFCESLFPKDIPAPILVWKAPQDLKRTVMVPPGYIILLTAPDRFRVRLVDESGDVKIQRNSVEAGDHHVVLLAPFETPENCRELQLCFSFFSKERLNRHKTNLLLLSNGLDSLSTSYNYEQIKQAENLTYLGTNGCGAMVHLPVPWGRLNSKYDAILAANLDPAVPSDRHIFWTRARIWAVYNGHSQELCLETLEGFTKDEAGRGVWIFLIPVGSGRMIRVALTLQMVEGENRVIMDLCRLGHGPEASNDLLGDEAKVQFIIRPDIEDRSFHGNTKAMYGPEHDWPAAIHNDKNGFSFSPDPARVFTLHASDGEFHAAGEWKYCVYHPVEAQRGMEAEGDLYSPGYFTVWLTGRACVQLVGSAGDSVEETPTFGSCNHEVSPVTDLDLLLERAMNQFVVKRDELKTVIAGYPWFLDWGRDTLICVRGLIAAGKVEDYERGVGYLKEVADIILNFARFADHGTLPNIIHGKTVGNRDTSDAPLWLFNACSELCNKLDSMDFLNASVPDRDGSLLGVLIKVAEGYISGTPNGIKMDADSGLIYSPSHFTWMDTNYPAGTPRQGYPIEIQALWFGAVEFLHRATGHKRWKDLADKVRKSVQKYYVNVDGWLCDCLHAEQGQSAAVAIPDDALRPNQLLALTLGLVDDKALSIGVLKAVSELLVPGGIRSLADRPVHHPLPIYGRNGELLNDPLNPYWGYYGGDEDTRRKPAYHNGTAWTWLFPSFPEAFYLVYGDAGKKTAKAWLASAKGLLRDGCVGQWPENLDGNYPHDQRGCDAQAWGVTELYRVWRMLR